MGAGSGRIITYLKREKLKEGEIAGRSVKKAEN